MSKFQVECYLWMGTEIIFFNTTIKENNVLNSFYYFYYCSASTNFLFTVQVSVLLSDQIIVLCLFWGKRVLSAFQSHKDVTVSFKNQISVTFKWSDTLCFECELPLEGNLHLSTQAALSLLSLLAVIHTAVR